jgi:hypothetical protein
VNATVLSESVGQCRNDNQKDDYFHVHLYDPWEGQVFSVCRYSQQERKESDE